MGNNFTVEASENEGVVEDSEEFKSPYCSQVVFRFYRIVGFVFRENRPVYSEATFELDYTNVEPVFKLQVTWQGVKTFEMTQQTIVDNDILDLLFSDLKIVIKECDEWTRELTHKFTMTI